MGLMVGWCRRGMAGGVLVVLVYGLTRHLALAVAGVLLFSSALELLRAWLPWRECSWENIQINLLAEALGGLVSWVGVKSRPRG